MIHIISCFSKNRVIGRDGKIPWKFPADLQHYKKITLGNTIVMGRKTFESVGKLPGRETIVLSSSEPQRDDVGWVSHPEEVVPLSKDRDIFVSGGEQVYYDFLPLTDYMLLTIIHQEIDGDTYFPVFDADEWDVVKAQRGNQHSYIEMRRTR